MPIPVAAHELLASVLDDLRRHYSRRDLQVAGAILKEATGTLCEEVLFVPYDDLERLRAEGDADVAGE